MEMNDEPQPQRTSSQSNNEDILDVLVECEEQNTSMRRSPYGGNFIEKEKITLTSRTTQVSIPDIQESGPIDAALHVVNALKNNFNSDIGKLSQILNGLLNERKSIDSSIKKLTEEREKYRVTGEQLRKELEILQEQYDKSKETNDALHSENQSMASEHERSMHSIADNHRRRHVARKTIEKWRRKMEKSPSLSNQEVAFELIKENERLKKDLIAYQESAKHAFIRSANALNFEAFGLFQNAAARLIQPFSDLDTSSQSSSTSDTSDRQSTTSGPDWPRDSNKENGRTRETRPKSSRPHSSKERDTARERTKARGQDRNDLGDPKTRHRQDDSRQNDLRREAREIMKQLEVNSKSSLLANLYSKDGSLDANVCHSKDNHIHICHCASLPRKSKNCPHCYPEQNYNFAKLPVQTKPQMKSNVRFDKRGELKTATNDTMTDRAKVIYKPSGSTVLIEKHIRN